MLSFFTPISYLQFSPTPVHFVMYSAHIHSPVWFHCAERNFLLFLFSLWPILHIWQMRIEKNKSMNFSICSWERSISEAFPLLSWTTIGILQAALPAVSAICKSSLSFSCVSFCAENVNRQEKTSEYIKKRAGNLNSSCMFWVIS